MKQRLVNKHIIRAISLGLTAVMASTPITALAEEVTADSLEPQPLPEQETDLLKNKDAEDAIEAAQETVDEGDTVLLDQPVVLPGSGEETENVPNALSAADASELEKVQTEVNGKQIEYKDVKEDLANAGNDLRSAESDLIQMDIAEGKLKADLETGTGFINESNKISNSVTADHTKAEDAATASQQAVEKAEAAENSDEIKVSLEVIEQAVKTTTEAKNAAQEKYDASEAELTKAHDKLVEAEKNLEAARTSLNASKSDVEKALKELEEAKNEADLLQQKVNEDAKDLKESQKAQLKAAYDQMKLSAQSEKFKEKFSLYNGGAFENNGYSEEFGREKASSQYWADSLDYFKLYMEYAYVDDTVADTNWIEQGEHFAKNNVYVIKYKDGTERYFNYHLEDATGEISIYEKSEGTEKYIETTFEEESQLVIDSVAHNQNHFDQSVVLEDTKTLKTETIEYFVDEERITEIEFVGGLDDFKAMLNSVKKDQVYEVEIISLTGNSKQVFNIEYGQNIDMVINDMFGLGDYVDAEGNKLVIGGQQLGAIRLKEDGYMQLGIKETVIGDVIEKDSVIVKLLFNQFKDVPSDSSRINDINSMIEDDAKAMGGTAINPVVKEVKEGEYEFTYTLKMEDGTTKQVKGLVSDHSAGVVSDSHMRNDIISEIQDEAKALGKEAANIQITGEVGSYTYTYDLVTIKKDQITFLKNQIELLEILDVLEYLTAKFSDSSIYISIA